MYRFAKGTGCSIVAPECRILVGYSTFVQTRMDMTFLQSASVCKSVRVGKD
jgi:hypothetical protein